MQCSSGEKGAESSHYSDSYSGILAFSKSAIFIKSSVPLSVPED